MIKRIIEARALQGFTLYLKYEDGVEGEVDLTYLASRGVFVAWNDQAVFESVTITPGGLEWPGGIDLCADALYQKLKERILITEDIVTYFTELIPILLT